MSEPKKPRREPELSITLGPMDVAAFSNQARLGNGCVCDSGCDSCGRLAEAFTRMEAALRRVLRDGYLHHDLETVTRAALRLAEKVRG